MDMPSCDGYMVWHRLSAAQVPDRFFSDALVLHADIQAKRARCFPVCHHSIMRIRNPNGSTTRRRHWWFLYADEYKKHPSLPGVDAFCPALVPAIHRERPGEIGRKLTGQVAGFHKSRSGTCSQKSRYRFAPVGAPVKLNPVEQTIHPFLRWLRSTAYMMPPCFVQDHIRQRRSQLHTLHTLTCRAAKMALRRISRPRRV